MGALKHRKRVRLMNQVSYQVEIYNSTRATTSKIPAIQNRGAVEDTQSQIYFIL